MTNPNPATSPQLVNGLVDVWQAETQVAYRLDEWLVRFLRGFGGVDAAAVGTVRSRYYRARHRVHAHVRTLGRAVVRLPMVAERAPDGSPDAAARGLQRLYSDLSRANRRLEAVSAAARRQRDFACLRALSELHEAHVDTLDLLRALFQRGQELSREALLEVA